MIVRYADDFVIGFEHEYEARQCWEDLKQRFAQFGLTLHPTKTRLLEFGRYAAVEFGRFAAVEFGRFAAVRRERQGVGRPESFDFLGFTHRCGKARSNG